MKLIDEQRMLVESNLNLVHHMIHKRCSDIGRNEYDDIYQTGIIGLCKAAAKFDSEKGIAFSTFAATCIVNEIYMVFRKQKKESCQAFILNAPIFSDEEGNELTIGDTLCAIENADSGFYLRLLNEMIKTQFKDRDKQIITMSIRGMTQQEIADEFGISQSYVSRRLKRIQEIVRREHCRDDRVEG